MLEAIHLILDPPGDPEANMAKDEQLAALVRAGQGPPALRIYGWTRPAISLGRRQSADELPPTLRNKGLPIVRRPTGGGVVEHQLEEVTYALALPRNRFPSIRLSRLPALLHRNLRQELVGRQWILPEDLSVVETDACGPQALCFTSPTCGDLLYRGRKVTGAALRIWRDGLLIQGSVQGLPVRREALVDGLRKIYP